jgi:dipeptidase E
MVGEMRLLLISSSLVHGYGYLDHAEPELRRLLSDVKTVAFVPFAQHDHEAYTATVRERMNAMGFDVTAVRDREDVERAEAMFIGGGNTFRLLNALYERDLLDAIRTRARNGMPYVGSSAGTNVATPSIRTTNDMPILYPPSFDALGLVSFQINPHYLDPDPGSTHHGETREQRIREFHEEHSTPVVGLREGSMLDVRDGVVTLVGSKPARIFRRGQEPVEIETGSRLEL